MKSRQVADYVLGRFFEKKLSLTWNYLCLVYIKYWSIISASAGFYSMLFWTGPSFPAGSAAVVATSRELMTFWTSTMHPLPGTIFRWFACKSINKNLDLTIFMLKNRGFILRLCWKSLRGRCFETRKQSEKKRGEHILTSNSVAPVRSCPVDHFFVFIRGGKESF